MKRILLLIFSLCFMRPILGRICDAETIDRLQELQRCISTIKSNVQTTQIIVIETEEEVSILGEVLCSKLDNINVSGLDELFSEQDIFICSKIGNFDDPGSCLDSQMDVPQDINDLNLNVIGLLKTILLELRGCNVPC